MKKFLKPTVLSLIALAILSCSSDDNKSNDDFITQDITVLRSIHDSNYYKIKGESEFKLVSTNLIEYNYNDITQLKNILSTDTKMKVEGDKKQETKDIIEDEIQYGENGKIKSIKTTNKTEGEIISEIVFEYDENNRIIKSFDKVDKITEVFEYNTENLPVKSIISQEGNPTSDINVYKYENGNLISAEKLQSKEDEKDITYFEYDNYNSPFKDMSVNNFSFEHDYVDGLSYAYTVKNNILAYHSEYNKDKVEIKYNYNQQNYPIQAETIEVEPSGNEFKTITKYTYQTITVIK